MKVGFLSDAHGNAYAANKCFKLMSQFDVKKIFYLGDAVGYFPDAKGVLELVHMQASTVLMGNHEAMLLRHIPVPQDKDEAYKISKTAKNISQDQIVKTVSTIPFWHGNIAGRNILCVHGSPWNPLNEYVYPDSDLKHFMPLPYDAIFMGHTHRPFIKKLGTLLLVNVGSCGLPRDQGDLASFAVYDTDKNECKIYRVKIHVQNVLDRYSGEIHQCVIDTLQRKSDTDVVGEIIE